MSIVAHVSDLAHGPLVYEYSLITIKMYTQHNNHNAKFEPCALCSCDILHSCYRIFCKLVLNNWFSFRMRRKQFIMFREVIMILYNFQNCETWETKDRVPDTEHITTYHTPTPTPSPSSEEVLVGGEVLISWYFYDACPIWQFWSN